MPLKFILKHSTVETSVPPNDYLILGELALNCADGIIYFKNGIGTISSLGGKATTTKYGITRLANSNTYDITTAKYITDSDLTDVITIDSLPIKLYENGAWGAFSLPPSVTDAKFGAYSLNLQSAYKRINSNDFNTGDYSVLVGVSNQGIGATSSLIVGNSNTSTATHNTVVGVQNTVGSNYSSAIGYANSIASGQESSTAIGIHGYVNASRSTAIGLNVQISTDDTLEFGYWSDPGSVRNGSLRVIKDGSVSWTVRKSDTAYLAASSTDGNETVGQLMKSGLAFRVATNGNNLIADYCDSSIIRSFKILNEADVINVTSLELERTPYFIAANASTSTLTINNNITLSADRAFTGIGTGLTLLNATNISTGTLAYARFGVDNLVGDNSVAVGYKNNNRTYTGIASITDTLGASASAIGYMNNTLGARSVALGYANITFASDSTAIGVNNNFAYNTNGGTKTLVSNGQNSTALGYKNFALSNYAVAIGTLNNTPTPDDSNPTLAGTYSLAVGYKNLAAATYSGAIGTLNSVTVNSDRSSAYGYSNTVAAKYSVALGISNIIASTATNLASSSHYNNSFGIGLENQVYIRDSYALGRLNKIGVGDTGNPNIAISSTSANAKEILAIGYSNTISTGVNIIAIGSSNTISGGTDIIVLGRNNTTLGQYNYIVGDNNTTYYKTATNLPDGTTAAGVSVTHTSDLSTIHGKSNNIYSDNQPGDLSDGTGIIIGNQNTIHSFFTYTSSRYVSIINSCNTIVTALNSAFTTFKNATTIYINNNSITYTGTVSNYTANVLTADTAISSFNGTNKTLSGGANIVNAITSILNNSSVNQGANSTAATAVKTALSTAVGVFRDGSSTTYGYVYWVNALITLYTNAGHVTNSGKINTLSSIVGYSNKVGLSDGYAYKLPATLNANVYTIPDSSTNILSFPAGGRSIASGYSNSVFGSNSSAFGSENAVAYNESIALGFKNSSLALRSITFGNNNLTYGLDSMAIGGYNRAQGRRSLSFGYYNNVMIQNDGSLINTVSGDYSSAIGHNNFALGNYSVALGTNNIVSSKNKTQLHYSQYDETFASMGIGYGNTVNKNYAVAIGTNITIQHPFVTEIGYWSSTTSRIAAMRIGCSTGSVNGSTINTPTANDGVTISGVTGTYIASEVNRRTHNDSHTAVVPLVNWTVSRTDTAYTSAAALENENGSSLMMSGLAFRMTTDNQLYADYNNGGSTLSMNLSENLSAANINSGLANHGVVIGLNTDLNLAASKTTIQNNLTVGGVINGNGSGLTNLRISQLDTGTGSLLAANLPANILYDFSDISIAKLTGASGTFIADILLPTTIVRTTGNTLATAISNLADNSIPLAKLVGGGVVSSPIDLSANNIIIGTAISPIETTTTIRNNLSVAGNISATGNVSATKFAGNGSLLTNLNAANITTGQLAIGQLPAIAFSNITGSIAAAQIAAGTITADKLAAGITQSTYNLAAGLIATAPTIGPVGTGTTTIIQNNLSVANSGVISGIGSGLTNLNATNLIAGTVDIARLPNITLPKISFGFTSAITTFAELKSALQIPASSGTYPTELTGINEIKFAYAPPDPLTPATYSTLIGADNKYLNNNGDGSFTNIAISHFQNCTIFGNKNLLHTGNSVQGSSVNYDTIKNTLLLGNHNTSHGDSCAIGHQNQIGGSGTANLESGQDSPHQVTAIGYEKGVDGFHNHLHTVLAKGSIVVGSNNVALQYNAILIGRNNIIHRQGDGVDGVLGTLDGSGSINGLTIGNGNKILSTGSSTFRNASAITVGHQNTIYNTGEKAIAIGCNNNIGNVSDENATNQIFAAGINNTVNGTNSVAIGINTAVGVAGTVVNNVMEIGLWESPNQIVGKGAAIRISGGNVGSAGGCINFSVEQSNSKYLGPADTNDTIGQLANRSMMPNSISFRITNSGNIAIDYCDNAGAVTSRDLGALVV